MKWENNATNSDQNYCVDKMTTEKKSQKYKNKYVSIIVRIGKQIEWPMNGTVMGIKITKQLSNTR